MSRELVKCDYDLRELDPDRIVWYDELNYELNDDLNHEPNYDLNISLTSTPTLDDNSLGFAHLLNKDLELKAVEAAGAGDGEHNG
jgi:hypothetical protein